MGIHFQRPLRVVFEPSNEFLLLPAPHSIVHTTTAGLRMVVGGLVVPELDVCTSEASTMVPVFLEVCPRDPEAGQLSVGAKLRGAVHLGAHVPRRGAVALRRQEEHVGC